MAAAVAVAGSVSLVQSASSSLGVDRVLTDLGSRGDMTVTQSSVIDERGYSDFQGLVQQRNRDFLGSLMVVRQRFALSADLFPLTLNGQRLPDEVNRPQLASYEQLEGQATFVAGGLPGVPKDGAAWNATVSETTAQALHLRTGDIYCANPINQPQEAVCVRVSGVWRARNDADPYWGGQGPAARALVVDRAQLYEIIDTRIHLDATAGSLLVPDRAAFRNVPPDQILDRLNRFRALYSVRRQDSFASTNLDTAIETYVAHARAAAFAVEVLAIQILAVTVFYLAFVAGQVLGRQRELLATWRARGWSRRAIWSVLMIEFLAIAAISVPAGLALAWIGAGAAARAVFGAGALSGPPRLVELLPPILVAAGAGLTILVGLAARAARAELAEVRPLASRPPVQGWWQWRSADLVLAALAVPLLLQARALGQAAVVTGGQIGSDPLSLLLPGLAILLLTLATLRLLPLVAHAIGWAGRGLAGRLAAWQLARNPGQHAGLALLFAVAIALGLFARTYSDTQARNSYDRAAYAVGADFRLGYDGAYPLLAGPVDKLEGVSASSQVFRGAATPGRTAFAPTVLGIDPATFAGVAWTRADLASEPLPALVQRLAGAGGVPLPGRPDRIGVFVNSPSLPVEMWADVRDAHDQLCSCRLGTLDYAGWRQLEAPIGFAASPTYPLRLMQLRFTLLPGAQGRPATGVIALSQLTAGPAVVDPFNDPTTSGAWWKTGGPTGLREPRSATLEPILRDRDLSLTVKVEVARPVLLRPPPGPDLPVLLPNRTLNHFGIRSGETFVLSPGAVGSSADNLRVKVVGVADHFPTLYPEKGDFMIVPRDAYLAAAGYLGQPASWPNEVWLNVADRSAATARKLLGGPSNPMLNDRRAVAEAALHDPIALELDANLEIGFITALLLALVAFGIHFMVSSRGRLVELAVLEANGCPPGLMARSLRIEQWALLGFSALAGAAAGTLLALVLLPSLRLSPDLSASVPDTVVTLEPGPTAATLVVVLVAAGTLAWILGRLGSRYRLMAVLRALG
jgi:hypothetical protein